jgi:hypothetical protein
MKKIELHDAPMPAFWAPYLINFDSSGMEEEEMIACDNYIEQQGIKDVFLEDEEEPYFSWSFDLYGGNDRGGDLLHYMVTLV